MEDEEFKDFDDKELDDIASEINVWEDIEDEYLDEELVDEDEETGEIDEEVITVNEVLSRVERLKLKARFARTKTKRMVKLRVALKRHSNNAQLNKRARRLAEKRLKERIARKPLNKMSVSEKERVEKILQKKRALVSRLALRMLPRIKKIEKDRLAKKYKGSK